MGLLALLACNGDLDALEWPPIVSDDTGVQTDDTGVSDDTGDSGDTGEPLLGFIGSPCDVDADCAFEGLVCLAPDEGFPKGMCSQACELYCPDADGYPTTFCAAASELPAAWDRGWDGACVSRCDFGAYPDGACRTDYACATAERANEPQTQVQSCLPGAISEITACQQDLADRGVDFAPTTRAPEQADGASELCVIDDPVLVYPPIAGVDILDYSGGLDEVMLTSCDAAHSIVDTVEDVADQGVVSVHHLGTYNCRVIAGTSTLSRHAYGDAIDLAGFEFADGTWWTLIDDWEHETTSFETDAGAFLYDAAHRWYDQGYWNIILTPNYNTAHDNHFHVDLTPGGDYIGFTGGYIGPAPYAD